MRIKLKFVHTKFLVTYQFCANAIVQKINKFKNFMKKKSLIMTGVSLLFAMSMDARIIIKRSGSTDGVNYNRVEETHGWFNHTLNCHGAGAIMCGWSVMPTVEGEYGISISTDEIVKFIDSEILKGKTGGTVVYSGVNVLWKYTEDNKSSVIAIYEKGEKPEVGDLDAK